MGKLDNIALEKDSGEFLYHQLYNEIKELILNGELPPDTKLPTIRKLAEKLEVNNVTVVTAYNQLEADGFIYKKVGSGSFVKKLDKVEKLEEELESSGIANFGSTAPTPNLFPVEEIKAAIDEVLDRDKANAFIYQESKGYTPLRKSLVSYLEKLNIDTGIDNIQIISGAQQGIDIISKAMVDYGDIVFTESPTYTGAIGVFNSRGARAIGIPIESDGIDIVELENKLKSFRPKFIYIMPNFQNPTGYSYSEEKKEKLLELASEYGFYIIEDDYLSDLHFNNRQNRTLKSMDKADRVIYIKSFSKLFMPGLRIAFMVVPSELYSGILSAKHISDISTPGLIQRAFDAYMRNGNWDENIKRINKVYDLRYRIMVKAVEELIPEDIEYIIPEGGLNFWFKLPSGQSSNELYEYLLERNISIAPAMVFDLNGEDSECFRLSVTSIDSEDIRPFMERITEGMKEFFKAGSKSKLTAEQYNKFL